MLTDEQEDIIAEALIPLFQYLEHEVIVDVANRIKDTMSYSRTAEIEAQRLQRLGFSPAKIRAAAMRLLRADSEFRKVVAKNTLDHKKTVKKILRNILREAQRAGCEITETAADLSYLDDLRTWKQAGKELTDKSFLAQLVNAIGQQTGEAMENLTGTTGFKTMSGYEASESLYRRELDKAMIKVCTGTFSQEQVVYDTVHSLAQSGLRTIDFASGYSMQLDTAVKLAVRTGAGQIAAQIMDKNIAQTGENLVYVSKHWGARNKGEGHANHEQWQGKVYFIKEGEDYSEEAKRIGQERITSLYLATGYSADGTHENDPCGLNGYNCRHKHYAWHIGISSFPENKDDPQPGPVTVDGKEYDYYAITQKMRKMERDVRALKREKEALAALNMDTKEIGAKIRKKIKDYKDFCDKAGVKPDINRFRYECGTADLKKTKAWKNLEGEYREYRVVDEDGGHVSLKEKISLGTLINKLPKSAQQSLSDVTFHVNSKIGGGYWYGHNEIYLPSNVSEREFFHEVGHCLEEKLFDPSKVTALKNDLVQGLTKDDIIIKKGTDSVGNTIKVFILDSPKFIKDYQGRLYVDSIEEALNPGGSINTDTLGEVISIAVEHYFMTPRAMKKNFPDMYKIVEETLYGQ